MWTSAQLKENAKVVMRRNYWTMFAVSLVYGILVGSFSGGSSGMNTALESIPAEPENYELIRLLSVITIVLAVVVLLIGIFVTNPLEVGLRRFYLENREREASFTVLFWGFRGGRYWKNVKVLLLRDVKILLWSLLLLIPGIIKTYEYYMISSLLAENPDMETKRYFEISRGMTRGEKMSIFVLGLSFLGWILLGMLACCVGVLFVDPYICATDAELYALMRAKASALGLAEPEELRGFGPQPYQM